MRRNAAVQGRGGKVPTPQLSGHLQYGTFTPCIHLDANKVTTLTAMKRISLMGRVGTIQWRSGT